MPFTAPNDGFIWIGYYYIGWGDGGQVPKIILNGHSFYGGYESTHANGSCVMVPVKKGDTLNMQDFTHAPETQFIPKR